MIVKDLMIGDFVRIKGNVEPDAYFMHEDMYPGQVVKVEEILSNGINPDWMGGEVNDYLVEDAIEPIPLTKEILEKNGFILSDGWWCNERLPKGNGYVSIAFDPDGEDRRTNCVYDLSITNHESGSVDLHLDYVHQLQHALKLCNIQKEIEL